MSVMFFVLVYIVLIPCSETGMSGTCILFKRQNHRIVSYDHYVTIIICKRFTFQS